MYLIVIAWMYVVLMMSVAEATHPAGTLLGALVTFVLYGVGPVALVVYLMRAPARRKAIKAREAAEASTVTPDVPGPDSFEPDAGSHPAGGAEAVAMDTSIAPVRKEP
ncbi:hypothetical protein [Polaromonas sp.]|uniref:hypothetical protein n=1 Tax=Polaromonas sp. TaxID=1869339 RepID=UPI003563E3C3